MREKKQIKKEPNNKIWIPQRLTAKNESQKEFIRTIVEHQITLCSGPAGSGKSICSIGLAVEYLLSGKCEKIIISRPFIESGESIGFLPGTLDCKVAPFLAPLLDILHRFLADNEIKQFTSNGQLVFMPLAYTRGHTYSNAFAILDEASSATLAQLKLFLTRIGENTKMVIVGDSEQSDLPKRDQGGLVYCIDRLQGIEGIGIHKFNSKDIVRSSLISRILERLQ